QEPPRQQIRGLGGNQQRRQVRRDDLQVVDGVAAEVLGQGGGTRGPLLGEDVQAATAQQGREDHGVTEIRGEGGDQREARRRRRSQLHQDAVRIVHELPVLDRDPFGPPGRAR